MQEPPLVSVILPAFNHEKYVEEAVLSVINQSYPNIQLIAVDDGSDDLTPTILERLSTLYGFYFERRYDNHGISSTLNYAKGLTKGRYVSLLASDDYYHPHRVARLVEFMEENAEYAIVQSGIIYVDSLSCEIGRISEKHHSGFIFEDLLLGKVHINGITALIRNSVFSRYQYRKSDVEDFCMWLEVAKDHRVAYVDDYLSYYRIHNNHVTSNSIRMHQAERAAIDEYSYHQAYGKAIIRWKERWFLHFSHHSKASHIPIAFHLGLMLVIRHPMKPSIIKGWTMLLPRIPAYICARMHTFIGNRSKLLFRSIRLPFLDP